MYDEVQHYRHLMIFFFNEGLTAAQTTRKICAVYGSDSLQERTVQRWFVRFRKGNFSTEDRERSGRPITADEESIKNLVERNRHLTTRAIAEIVGTHHSTVQYHLKRLGYVKKADIWINDDKLSQTRRMARKSNPSIEKSRRHNQLTDFEQGLKIEILDEVPLDGRDFAAEFSGATHDMDIKTEILDEFNPHEYSQESTQLTKIKLEPKDGEDTSEEN